MKKILLAFTLLFILIAVPVNSFAKDILLSFFDQNLKMAVGLLPAKALITLDSEKPSLSGKLESVKYTLRDNQCEVLINLSSYQNYKVMKLSNPDRIVIDITNAQSKDEEQQKISVSNSFVQAIRYSQFETQTVRLVVDVVGQTKYKVLEKAGQLVLNITGSGASTVSRGGDVDRNDAPEENASPTPTPAPEQNASPTPTPAQAAEASGVKNKNIKYQNVGDRVCLIINNAKLTEGGADIKKLYNESYDSTGKKYTMSFPTSYANLDNEIIKVNDNTLDSIEILKDNTQTSITFNAKEKFYYNAFSRSELNDTAITILKPSSKADRLVVIDPGHGGIEPGAEYANIQEKDLNLDISQRLNALLKSQNIKTYITRNDDSFIGLYERTSIANNLNATLFICVHNNAYYVSDKGTETLYNFTGDDNGSFNSKKLAQIIQTSLVKALGTVDREIVYRPNLVVLKGTTMPAALAEIGFITNDEDRANLLNSEFRQKAAAALCQSIINALSMMGS